MTKKHFIALADALRYARTMQDGQLDNFQTGISQAIQCIADACKKANPRFNRERWLGYIAGTNGKNGGKVKVAA